MVFKNICDRLNIVKQCQKHDLSVWQCPQFLFLVMGIVIILSALTIYAFGNRYIEDPLLVALIVLLISFILLIIAATITRSFEKLAEANKMKTEFISIVSHQLRSPLANLRWVIEILMSGKVSLVSEERVEYFKILKENSQRMIELVSDLLTVSRIEQGKFFLKKEKISLENLVKKTIDQAKLFIEASNIQISFNSEKNLPQVIGDDRQIKLAIENLLDNAIRYVQKRGKIEISLKKKKRDLFFEIKDNGVGIPKEDQKYIFQKFFRSGNIKKHQTDGSGLGLYIARSIIEKSGGKMGFKSQEDIGSTFWFTIPIRS